MPPLNLAGDFGGGSMFLLVGILAALWERQTSGKGQVVDAAMVDGSSVLMADDVGVARRRAVVRRARHQHARQRRAVLRHLRVRRRPLHRGRARSSRSSTPSCSRGSASTARTCPPRTTSAAGPSCAPGSPRCSRRHDRDHWAKVFADTDACATPVLSFAEVRDEPHITERDTFYLDGDVSAAVARAAVLPQRAAGTPKPPGRAGRPTPKPSCATGNSPQPTSRSATAREGTHQWRSRTP